MNMPTKFETDLTVRSFAYVVKQLIQSSVAQKPSALYAQILREAEKHRSALRLVLRDVFEMTEQELRKRTLTKAEFQRMRDTAAGTIRKAQQEITCIATQYAPHELAA
jgi:hypothetical protein